MNLWRWLARQHPERPRGNQAHLHLVGCYQRVFVPGSGTATDEDKEIVLADFANWTGFYRVNGPEMDGNARAHSDGMRAAFGRVFQMTSLTDEQIGALGEAARAEAIADAQPGV